MLAAIVAGDDGGNEGRPGLGDGPRWSKLRSIGARNLAKPLDLVVLRKAILKFQEGGRPFSTLSLPQQSVAHLDANAMAELRGIISIGDFSDDWPMPFNFW
ncbi:hypothetical protein FIBSPDRAFT_861566 [Athelia psychrophila]|uniref:Uncharacterized protein n=1 Tax=Athelia psychrophila TaxID=1759441 RepID=A0A166J770_9AGAM|nr:hypothetical protein FIBSPDRAFT_861566 [Fibularhizoctonia sp. CBS 109695]